MSNSETQNLCGLKREDFQTTINGKHTDLYPVSYTHLTLPTILLV